MNVIDRTGAFKSARSLVRGEGLTKAFPGRGSLFSARQKILAVRGVDITVGQGEAVGVVGESGCGKSTLGRLLLQLLPLTDGRVLFDGDDISGLKGAAMRAMRRRMQLVFQDPYGSLDPRRSIGAQIADGIRIHRLAGRAEIGERVNGLLRQVGLDPGQAQRLPHEFSGGQRQRIAIARALSTAPEFIVADEPVSALDVSIQAQVVNLLADLRQELGLALLFISHDLHVVRHLCDRVVVMYLGRVVEEGAAQDVFQAPAHPYTRALIGATPSLRQKPGSIAALSGEIPSVAAPPSGCVFRTRCPMAQPACADAVPELAPLPGGHQRRVACWRAGEI
ncbi:MAG: ATP-binding cassette domain-containing protein [Rhizobiales bacterium]|nr:ATP-binding cassette domain-containing protein [Hyphomicrobiales bacterium]